MSMNIKNRLLFILVLVLLCMLPGKPVLAETNSHISVVGQDYVVETGTTLNDDLAVVGGDLTMQPGSQVNGQVVVSGGNADIRGTINGNLVVFGGKITLADTAVVNGDVISPGIIERASGAVVNGRTVSGLGAATDLRLANGLLGLGGKRADNALYRAAGTLAVVFLMALFILLAGLSYLLWENRIITISETVQSAWLYSLGVGLLTLLVFVVMVPILVVICIGIPIALVALFALVASIIIGSAAIGRIVGRWGCRLLKVQAKPVVEILCGCTLLALLALIPCIGMLLAVLTASVGIGAAWLTRFGSTRYPAIIPGA